MINSWCQYQNVYSTILVQPAGEGSCEHG